MKLYYNPLSTYSQKVLIALYEKGETTFQREIVQLMDPQNRAAYEAIYPLGKVPLLQLDDGYKIPESTIIIEYLETHSKGTRLIPHDADAARRVRFHDRLADLYLNDSVSTLLFDKFKFFEIHPSAVEKAHKMVKHTYSYFDKLLGESEWLVGKDFSMADCAAIPPLFYAEAVAPIDGHPNLLRYFQQAQKRASYRHVQEEFVPIWKERMAAR